MRRLVRPRVAAALGAAAVLVGGGVATYAATAEPGTRYRTATATLGDVDSSLALSGTLAQSGRLDLSFGASGTVGAVRTRVGDTVRAGQVLARLDRTSLKAAVTRARAELAAARARLETDEDAQATAVSSAATPSASGSTPSGSSGASGAKAPTAGTTTSPSPSAAPSTVSPVSPQLAQALAVLEKEQHAVTTAQSAASAALAVAEEKLATQTEACDGAFEPAPTGGATDGPSPSDGSTASSGDTQGSQAQASAADQACVDALGAVQDAQAAASKAQDQLQSALGDLADTLEGAVASLQHASPGGSSSAAAGGASGGTPTPQSTGTPVTGPTAGTGDAQGQGTSGTGPSPSAGSESTQAAGQSSGRTVTAATLAQDQADIDRANADLVRARQALDGAVIRAPRAGTVASVDVTVGGSASAGTEAVVLISPGTTTVELAVSSTNLAELAVGQTAQVTPAGAAKALTGSVTRIGRLPDTSSGSATYPVVVTLDDTGLGLPSGGTAAVDIVVGTAEDVVTVPTSAVTDGTVTVLDSDTVRRIRVTTGVVGRRLTEITGGLRAGQRVVLADLDQALPTGDTSPRRGFGGGLDGGVRVPGAAGGFRG